jgi:uncharacterized protein (DUF1800 family)
MVNKITRDPAMILFLGLAFNTKWAPNENYARELMELFTLGADRGAYSEDDARTWRLICALPEYAARGMSANLRVVGG